MSQVLDGELGLLEPSRHLAVKFVESASQWAGEIREVRKDSAQAGTEKSIVDSSEEQSGAQSEIGESVTMRTGDAFDDLVQSKAPEVIGHLPSGQGGWV